MYVRLHYITQVLLRYVHHWDLDQVGLDICDLPEVTDGFVSRKEGNNNWRGRQPDVGRHAKSRRHDAVRQHAVEVLNPHCRFLPQEKVDVVLNPL